MGLRNDADDRWLKETASKKRKEIVPSLFPRLTGSQLVISMAERETGSEREAEQIRERICQFLASMMTDYCATGALITIKRAPSHTIFTSLPPLYSLGGNTCIETYTPRRTHADTHTHTDTHRGETLISGRKEYNEWVIKTQGRIAVNLCPLSEHRSHDKRRISARRRRQAACAHWGDEIGSISTAIGGKGMVHWLFCLFFFSFLVKKGGVCLYRRTNSTLSNNHITQYVFTVLFTLRFRYSILLF